MIGSSLLIITLVVLVALAFDFTNGFHDTANSVAPTIATRALAPGVAVAIAAVANFFGALVAGEVAATIGTGIVDPLVVTPTLVLGALCGALAWNIATWWFGIPCSSSLALVGGLVGAGIAHAGSSSVGWSAVAFKVSVPALLAPVLGGVLALAVYWLTTRMMSRTHRRPAERLMRRGQIASCAWLSFTHGANDARKTMGVIALALLAWQAGGATPDAADFAVPLWVKLLAATTMALGTAMGGWRIINTMSRRITSLDAPQGFAASMSSGIVLMLATRFGLPVSTTYSVVGSIMGAGAARGVRRVRWTVGREIAAAWLVTLPCAAVVGALSYRIALVAPLLIAVVVIAALVFVIRHNHRDGAGTQRAIEPLPPLRRQSRTDTMKPVGMSV